MTTEEAKALAKRLFDLAPVRKVGQSLADWRRKINDLPAEELGEMSYCIFELNEWASQDQEKK